MSADHELVVLCREVLRGESGTRPLVVDVVVEADREGAERLCARLAGEREHRGRVDSTAQQDSERHVAHETPGGCFSQEVAQVGRIQRNRVLRRLDLPVAPRAVLDTVVDGRVCRRQSLDAREQCPRGDDVALEEVLGDVLHRELGLVAGDQEDGTRVRSEREALPRQTDVERLLPEPIARKEKPLAP